MLNDKLINYIIFIQIEYIYLEWHYLTYENDSINLNNLNNFSNLSNVLNGLYRPIFLDILIVFIFLE